uniref:Uncharacterized protein n=1 Tax=uncultured marine virus TaxID=186617 RepID=A0A0F7L412_9VIRU|nr:hypothetical protein [uncultured marine virus]
MHILSHIHWPWAYFFAGQSHRLRRRFEFRLLFFYWRGSSSMVNVSKYLETPSPIKKRPIVELEPRSNLCISNFITSPCFIYF